MVGVSSNENNQPIDVVVAWVDGGDPKLAEKRSRYLSVGSEVLGSSALPTRFASVNEIKYCILSIFRFAPFVRNVYIVTDAQNPNLNDDIKCYFPDRLNSIRIVDHKEIFEGYEDSLPTFNSISIGNMIWRIKGLSDNFVYFNDDTFLIRPIQPEDWFVKNKPVIRGDWMLTPVFRILWNKIKIGFSRFILLNSDYNPRASFHLGQWNSAFLLGQVGRYFLNRHTPHTVAKPTVEHYFRRNEHILKRNISYRFRNRSQFTFIALSNHLQLLEGNKQIESPALAYLQPYKRSKQYIDRKIRYCQRNTSIKYMCVQSLDLCPREQQDKLFRWLESIMGLQTTGKPSSD